MWNDNDRGKKVELPKATLSTKYFGQVCPVSSEPEKLSRYSDSLRGGWSADRIPVWARFSALAQTGPGAHPAPYTIGNGSFPGVMRPGRDVYHPPPYRAEVKERVQLYLYTPSGPSWPVLG